MKGLILGLVGTIAVVYLSLIGDISLYFQEHAIILVVGGTFTLLFFATPDRTLKSTIRTFFILFEKEERFEHYIDELTQLARTRALPQRSNNSLIRYAQELWEQGIDANLFIVLISQKKMEAENDTFDALQAMKNLSKYPPGLGITGTVMGMIALFTSLDSNKDSIGSHIALAMSATFFGLLLSNAIVAPIADRIQIRYLNQKRLLANVYKILLLINQDEPTALISNELEGEQAVA